MDRELFEGSGSFFRSIIRVEGNPSSCRALCGCEGLRFPWERDYLLPLVVKKSAFLSGLLAKYFFLKNILFIYLRDREHEQKGEAVGEGEADSPLNRGPDAEFDPGTLRS